VKPLLFVTGHAPAYRVGALARLHAHEGIELALFGGRSKHGGEGFEGEMPFPHRQVHPHELARLAASGAYRAIIVPTGGRLAPLASWAGARRARVPLILWASLWAHPRSAAHAITYLPLRGLYRSADAVVTYGPHVSAYVRARGARNVHVAPQSVDNDFWSASEADPASSPTVSGERSWPAEAGVKFVFVGRPAREKGLATLLEAWRAAAVEPADGALALVGVEAPSGGSAPEQAGIEGPLPAGVVCMDPVGALELRDIYAAADVLVLPSIPTATFREPWGLVVNEAMNRALPVIVTDAVGAAAGGLVRDGRNGLVVASCDSTALAAAIGRLAGDPALRRRLGAAGAEDVKAFSHDAWARGFSEALATLGLSRGRW
jgi:glycosyltransferase involved in cell wall biosynthesis